jgi:hypothetical protein
MAKRISDEARVVSFFATAPVEKAELVMGIAKQTLAQRTKTATPIKRRAQKAVTNTVHVGAVQFPTPEATVTQ